MRVQSKPIERDVKRAIKAYLDSLGAYWFMPVPTGFGRKTIDFLCCVNGRFIGIECKRPGVYKADPFQRRVIEDIIRAGGLAFVTDSLERAQMMIEDHILGAYDYARDD